MRILHAISSIDPRAGGTASTVVGLAEAQVRLGEDVTVLATFGAYGKPEVAEQLRKAGVKVRLVGPASGAQARHPELRAVVDEAAAGADVIHIHAMWEQIQHLAARAGQRLGRPYVVSPQGMLDPWSLRQRGWKKRLYLMLRMRRNLNRAAAIHCTTQAELDLQRPLKLKAPAIIEPLGIDAREFENLPSPGEFRAKFPAVGGRPIVLFLSRVHYKKGLDLLVPAFARAKMGDAMLVIAGPAAEDYRQTVQGMIDREGLRERAIFTGMLQGRQRIEALVAAELFVLPSYQENFGIAVIEAGAAGIPVVISDQINIHDQVTANGLGAVVPTQVEPLAEQLTRWMSDEQLRRSTGEHARQFVREHFDWLSIARRWQGHYRNLKK